MALIGFGLPCPLVGTSKIHPCVLANCGSEVLSGPLRVSSQVSQLPQGVTPPAQFLIVPDSEALLPMNLPEPLSNVTCVVPPGA